MPNESHAFTRASILVRPHGKMVEAPGTAPGSASAITQAVYRHSRLPGTNEYRVFASPGEGAVGFGPARSIRPSANPGQPFS